MAATGSQELCEKSPPLLGFSDPAGAGETVRIGGNGGGKEIRTHGTALRTPMCSWVLLVVPGH